MLVDLGGFLGGRPGNQHLLRGQHIGAAGGLHNLLATSLLGGRGLSVVLQEAGQATTGACRLLGRARVRTLVCALVCALMRTG